MHRPGGKISRGKIKCSKYQGCRIGYIAAPRGSNHSFSVKIIKIEEERGVCYIRLF